MPHPIHEKNRRAPHVNPVNSGVRTGNEQLESHEGSEVRSSPRQRPPRRGGKAPGKPGQRRSSD